MYIAIAVLMSGIMGGGASMHFGVESLFITVPVSVLIGMAGAYIQEIS